MKSVLITGATSGIGRAAAELFAGAGWDVIGVGRREAEDPRGRIRFLTGDVSDPASIKEVLSETAAMVETLDCIVNNAAMELDKPLVEIEDGEWDALMATNLRPVFLFARDAYEMLRRPGASIVNVSSVHAIATSINISAYAASKGAMNALTRALALEFAPEGIRVNAVIPGAVDTPMLRAGVDRGSLEGKTIEDKLETLSSRTPVKRIGRPEEIAEAILFLADNDRSSFITGQALVVDGGALARLSTE